jgi:hypothetical protein
MQQPTALAGHTQLQLVYNAAHIVADQQWRVGYADRKQHIASH